MQRKRLKGKVAIKQAFLQPEAFQIPSGAQPPAPFLNQGAVPGLFGPSAGAPSTPKKNPFQSIFSAIDKMGGIDVVLSTIGKVQKMVGVFQQLKPMFSLFGALGGSKAKTNGLRKGHKSKNLAAGSKVPKMKHHVKSRRS